jgi:hypothetical protein
MTRSVVAILALAAAGTLGACGSDGSADSGPPTCSGSKPIECRTPEGVLVGCCPEAHPVCSADGKSCTDFGLGGSGGSGNRGGSDTGGVGGSSASGGSGATGGSSGGTGGTGATGATGGTGATCADTDEPANDEKSAMNLGAIDDCDGSGSSVDGVLDGKNDVDWFVFWGKDTLGCIVDPFASSGVKARVCVFADCASATVSCSSGTIAASPLGRPGCCVSEGGQISLSLGCNGIDDSASIYIRVDQAAQDVCQAYTVDYHD